MKQLRKKRDTMKIKTYAPVVSWAVLALLLAACTKDAGKAPTPSPGESYLAELETRDVAELQKEIREAKEEAKAREEENTKEETQKEESGEETEEGTEEAPIPEESDGAGTESESEGDSKGEEAGKARLEELLADLRGQVESGEVTELTPEELGRLKRNLQGTVIIGDSMAQAAIEYDLLPETSVFFQRGGITRQLGPVTDQALALYPENVVFFTGLNDADHETYDSYPEAYAERVAQVRAALPDAKIWICSMTPPSEALGAVREDLARAPVFDQVLEAWCASSPDATYVDLKWMVRQDWYMADGIHFKRSFYLIWLQYLEGLLEEETSGAL